MNFLQFKDIKLTSPHSCTVKLLVTIGSAVNEKQHLITVDLLLPEMKNTISVLMSLFF